VYVCMCVYDIFFTGTLANLPPTLRTLLIEDNRYDDACTSCYMCHRIFSILSLDGSIDLRMFPNLSECRLCMVLLLFFYKNSFVESIFFCLTVSSVDYNCFTPCNAAGAPCTCPGPLAQCKPRTPSPYGYVIGRRVGVVTDADSIDLQTTCADASPTNTNPTNARASDVRHCCHFFLFSNRR
jgi:hypothetical protein